jgi:hypothetical protein
VTWLAHWIRRWRNRPDRAWKPTGIRQIYTGYDAAIAEAATRRRRELARRLDARPHAKG